MRFFWGGHFEFSKSAILIFFLLHISERPSPFIWGIIFFCTMDGFSRILEKKGGGLLCTRLYLAKVLFLLQPPTSCWIESNKYYQVWSYSTLSLLSNIRSTRSTGSTTGSTGVTGSTFESLGRVETPTIVFKVNTIQANINGMNSQ